MMARNKEYWKDRAAEKILDSEALCQRHESQMKEYFQQAEKEIEDRINRLYSKYAVDNKVSLQEAKKYLTNNELEEFKRDLEFYVSRAKNPYFRKEYRAYLQALSTRVRVQRLEALKAHVHHVAENAFVRTAQNAEKLFKGVYDTVYYRTAFDAFKSINMGFDVKPYDDYTFNALLSHPWSGADFSEKIWGNTAVFEKQLDEIMTRGMIQGKSNQNLTREIMDATGNSRKNAIRLSRTETNYIANQATNDMYAELGVEEYEFLAILDEKTSFLCWDLDGEHFPIKDAVPGNNYPPMHPNCRSTTVPYFEDMVGDERTAFVGKDAYKIPKDMTYKQWRGEYIDGASKSGEGLAAKVGGMDGIEEHDEKIKLGTVDFNDKSIVQSKIEQYTEMIAGENLENAVVISPKGNIYQCFGTSYRVYPDYDLGAELKGAYVTHNHPAAETYYSFSDADISLFMGYNLKELVGVDDKYIYTMIRTPETVNIERDVVYHLFKTDFRMAIFDKMFNDPINMDEDEYHEITKMFAEKYKFKYERRLRDEL